MVEEDLNVKLYSPSRRAKKGTLFFVFASTVPLIMMYGCTLLVFFNKLFVSFVYNSFSCRFYKAAVNETVVWFQVGPIRLHFVSLYAKYFPCHLIYSGVTLLA